MISKNLPHLLRKTIPIRASTPSSFTISSSFSSQQDDDIKKKRTEELVDKILESTESSNSILKTFNRGSSNTSDQSIAVGFNPPAGNWGPIGPSSDDISNYLKDTKTLAKWLDLSVIRYEGKVFASSPTTFPAKRGLTFPNYTGLIPVSAPTTDVSINNLLKNDEIKIITLSFKNYGYGTNKPWLNFLHQHFPQTNEGGKNVSIYNICVIQYGFLKFFKKLFFNNTEKDLLEYAGQNSLNDMQKLKNQSLFFFGDDKIFASKLLLPNSYTGYVFLLDKQNRIRWQSCGKPSDKELQLLLNLTQEIKLE